MIKHIFLSAAMVVGFSVVNAQQQRIIPCHTDEATERYFLAHPEEKARYEKEMEEATFSPEYLDQLSNRMNGQNSIASAYPLDTIAVVFHILHQGGNENIPNSLVYQALDEVNRVHTKTIPDSAQIDSHFTSVSGSNCYVFQLATKDPNGNCTNGIVRHYDVNTTWDQDNPSYSYTWDRKKYLNVYIVKAITGSTIPAGSIVVGYTYLPGTVSAGSDVIVYNCGYLSGT